MIPFDIKSYLARVGQEVDASLLRTLPSKSSFPVRLHESMHYSLFAGGKRIRPLLCLAAAEASGGDRRDVMPVACALEMIHTFSLIHDDLPAMDDDHFRRGVPTNHRVFGEGVAILAGDALLAEAFLVLCRCAEDPLKRGRSVEIICDIAEATGAKGMVGGQVCDLESEGQKLDLDSLRQLHRLKTGRLLAVSVTSGAKMVGVTDEKMSAFKKYGETLGLAFQIADDILDIEGGKELGKDIGSDVANHKATFPSILGLEASRKEARHLVDEAMLALETFGTEADALRALAQYIVERRK